MSSSVLLDPRKPISRFHLEGVRDGLFKLEQWGYEVQDLTNPNGKKRRVTYFEVIKTPEDDAEISPADALLFFTTIYTLLPDAEAPACLGTVEVTDSYINDRFWRE